MAKGITDPIRYKYNKFPTFNDDTDQFEFESIYNFPELEIATLIADNGYTLIAYKSTVVIDVADPEGSENLEGE